MRGSVVHPCVSKNSLNLLDIVIKDLAHELAFLSSLCI
jgi:hypothetical protein